MSESRRRALVLAQEPEGPGGRVTERLEQRGFQVDTHIVVPDRTDPSRYEPLPSLDGYDLLVPMGSYQSLTERDEIKRWVDDEIELIRRAHERGVPVLGICFGGQLIAEAFGGHVEKSPVTQVGWYELDDGPDGPNPIGAGPWMCWHHDRFTPPPGAEVLATTPSAPQLIRLGTTIGTQFHPEVDVAHIDGFLGPAPDEYFEAYGLDRNTIRAEMAENEARNVEQCYAFVDWFLDAVGLA